MAQDGLRGRTFLEGRRKYPILDWLSILWMTICYTALPAPSQTRPTFRGVGIEDCACWHKDDTKEPPSRKMIKYQKRVPQSTDGGKRNSKTASDKLKL